MVTIQRPITYYIENGKKKELEKKYWPRDFSREKREVSAISDVVINWYSCNVLDADNSIYIHAALRASASNEAYLLMRNEYVLVDYAPGSTNDKVINGPLLICHGFPSLRGTALGEHGIDCAFDTHSGTEAYIFSGNLCARIDYAPGTTNDTILKGPTTIADMFSYFKHTDFETGLDAAFTSTTTDEASIFKGDKYALINYKDNKLVHDITDIKDGFDFLKGIIFENGIDAAFASHRTDEAYIFKGQKYALIDFAQGTIGGKIYGDDKEKPIIGNWNSFVEADKADEDDKSKVALPRPNRGFDIYEQLDEPDSDNSDF